MEQQTYTTKELCEMFGISRARVYAFTHGREVRRNGRIEWRESAILDEKDWKHTIRNKRLQIEYTAEAVRKIAERLQVAPLKI